MGVGVGEGVGRCVVWRGRWQGPGRDCSVKAREGRRWGSRSLVEGEGEGESEGEARAIETRRGEEGKGDGELGAALLGPPEVR